MSNVKIPLLLLVLASLLMLLAGERDAFSFHNGGAGECEGCHTIHNSSKGVGVTYNALPVGMANAYLLLGTDPTSTCLICHQHRDDLGPTTFHISTPDVEMPSGIPPKQLSPGGDFGWLKKNYSWVPAVGQPTAYSFGERHGHNVVSSDYGYAQDTVNNSAPGGIYPSASLSCISCHDPHGKYRRNVDGTITTTGKPIGASGSFATSPEPNISSSVGAYRLLGGIGYYTKAVGKPFAFVADVPVAIAPMPSNTSEAVNVTRVGYGAGMSQWCRNCHTNIHDSTFTGNITHSTSAALGPTISNNYNSYLMTGNVSGLEATAYSSLVPFEVGSYNYQQLKVIVSTTPGKGPDSSDGTAAVMCLTCHRAHASGWDESTRWNTKVDYIVYNGFYSQQNQIYQPYGQGRSELEAQAAYYQTPKTKFASMQKSLCNKCHINDLN